MSTSNQIAIVGSPTTSDESLFQKLVSFTGATVQPAAVLWFGRCLSLSGVRAWWRKRRCYPGAALFLVPDLSANSDVEWRLCCWLVRRGFGEGIIVHNFSDTIPPSQLDARFLLHSSDPVEISAWIAQRLGARARSVLLADPSVSLHSPSLRSVVNNAESLINKGWEIDVWCSKTSLESVAAHQVRLPGSGFRPAFLGLFTFFFAVNLFAWFYRLATGRKPAAIVYTTSANLISADVCAVHFCLRLWLQVAKTLGPLDLRERFNLVVAQVAAVFERWQHESKSLRLLLPVSAGIGLAVGEFYGNRVPQQIVPNDYDPNRFNPVIRQGRRSQMRALLGYSEDSFVLAFTSYGHYRRKGFWLAVDGLRLLQERGYQQTRLLVIGGTPSALNQLRAKLQKFWPDGASSIRFVGLQPAVENYLAAADAFLFPSFFEAAARAPVEAAAMGLPLFITNVFGTENLVDGAFRGAKVKPLAADIADRVQAYLTSKHENEAIVLPAALTPEEYSATLDIVFSSLLD